MLKKVFLIAATALLFPVAASAHGGVEHVTDGAVVTLYQSPLSPIVRDHVQTDFIFADKNGERLEAMPVKLTLTDIHEANASKDRMVLTRNMKTDASGIIHFDYRYPKPDFYDIDLDFKVVGQAQEAGFLLQIRNPYKNWYSLTYLLVLAIGVGAGWLLTRKRFHNS